MLSDAITLKWKRSISEIQKSGRRTNYRIPSLEQFLSDVSLKPTQTDLITVVASPPQYNLSDIYYWRFVEKGRRNLSVEDTKTLYAKTIAEFASKTQPFDLPDKSRFDGMWIVAPPDSGKTTFISALINQDLKRVARGECSVFVMDSQNELIPDIAHLQMFAPGGPLHGKLIYIEPTSRHPLGLNIFDTKHKGAALLSDDDEMAVQNSAIWMIEFFLKSLVKSEESSHQETYLQFVIPAVLAIPRATIFTLMNLLEPPPPRIKDAPAPGYERYKQYFGGLRPGVQRWLKDRMHSSPLAPTRDAIRARIEGIYARNFFYDMLAHPENKFDFFTELQSGKVILVNTKKALLKGDTEPFGRYFIARLLQAAEERMLIDRGKRLPVYAYIDEAADYLSEEENIEELISKARKQKVAITVANQFESQIKLPIARDALSKAAIQCRGMPAPEGQTPAWRMSINAAEPVSINVPNVRFREMPKISDRAFDLMQQEMRDRYCVPPGYEEEEYVQRGQSDRTTEEPPRKDRTGPPKDDEYDDRYDQLDKITVSPAKARMGTVLTVSCPNGRTHQQSIPAGTHNGYQFASKGPVGYADRITATAIIGLSWKLRKCPARVRPEAGRHPMKTKPTQNRGKIF